MANKSPTVKQAGRKGGNATKRKWQNDKKFAATQRKKLSAAGKKSGRVRKAKSKKK
jgi:general stress protein YciG